MSETDDQPARRPPTIELAATEVDSSAEQPTAAKAESASANGEHGSEQASAGSHASTSGRTGRRLFSLIASALIGAAAMAAAAAVAGHFVDIRNWRYK